MMPLLCSAVMLPSLIITPIQQMYLSSDRPAFMPQALIRVSSRHRAMFASKGDTAEAEEFVVSEGETTKMTKAEVEELGNLVADDEWLGLATELAIVLRSSVRERMKANVRDFIGKDEYKVSTPAHLSHYAGSRRCVLLLQIGDISKEADARIKRMVADMRDKDEYELGDLSIAIDGLVKEEVCKLTGKDEYQCVWLAALRSSLSRIYPAPPYHH